VKSARYLAYLGFGLAALLVWSGLALWLFLRDYGCGEGSVAAQCSSVGSRIGYWLLLLSFPITALIFTYFRKIRKAFGMRDHTWRNQ
jgi:hypothetical protein